MSNDDTPVDQLEPEQETAATTLDRNVSLMAGAGTGKTTTLTARYIQILAHELHTIDDPEVARRLPERILTTTFTERAAEDLKRKVRDRINDRLSTTSDPETYALWRAVADGIDAGYVYTLHGFCHRILVEHAPHVTGLEPGFDTLDEAAASDLQSEVVHDLLETPGPYDVDTELRSLAVRFDRSALHDILTGLLADQAQTRTWCTQTHAYDSKTEYLEDVATFLPVSPESAGDLFDALWPALETICRIHEAYERDDIGAHAWDHTLTDLVAWCDELTSEGFHDKPPYEQASRLTELCQTLTTKGERYSDGSTHGKGSWRNAGHEDADAFVDAIDHVLETLRPEERLADAPLPATSSASLAVDAGLYDYLQQLAKLAMTAIEAYQAEKEEQDVVDFDDQIRLTTHLLDSLPEDQRTAIREQFQYVMVDEFQDTNPRQWQLVKQLVARDPDAFDAENVFLVGDVKQSIYRFRDADVTVFSLAASELDTANTQSGRDHDQPPLTKNFRTLPATLSAINGLFDAILSPDTDNGHEAFEAPPEALRPGRTNPDDITPVVEYLPIPTGDLRESLLGSDHDLANSSAATPAALEADALASRLAELLNADTQVYREPDDPDGEEAAAELTPSDIAILLRSRGELKAYERALRNADIPFTVIKGEGFYETPEIRHLRNLLKTLTNPTDDISLYATLRSPLFGQPDDTIAQLTADHDTDHLWSALQAATELGLTSIADDLERWRRYAGTHPDQQTSLVESWAELLSRILEETGYLAAVSADERGDQSLPNVEQFRTELRSYSTDGVHSLQGVVRRIEDAADRDTREAEANAATDGSGVQVLTVHEAKGQEYPVVAVPGIGRQFNDKATLASGRVEFETIADTPILGLKGPDPDDPLGDKGSILRAAAKTQRKQENRAEEKRIFYVAATRARDHLLLTGRHKPASDCDATIPVREPKDPDEAQSWRDWVQPAIFGTDDTAHQNWETLVATGSFTTQLPYRVRDPEAGDYREKVGELTVSVPPETTRYQASTSIPESDLGLSPQPDPVPWRFKISPHALSQLAEGNAEFIANESTRQYTIERTNTKADEQSATESGDWLEASVFGEAVHRLCEIRPPRDQWRAFVAEVVADEALKGEDVSGWEDEFDKIAENAERGIQYVDNLYLDEEIVGRYDELLITHEFSGDDGLPLGGELTGYIDHLTVTEDEYHIVDYKTNRPRDGEIVENFAKRQTDHHYPQLAAYATILKASQPSKAVRLSLVFTQLDTSYTWDTTATVNATEEFHDIVSTALQTVM